MPGDPHKKVPDLSDLSGAPLIDAAFPRIVANNKDTENNRGVAVSRAGRPKCRIVRVEVWRDYPACLVMRAR
jgi:hypothetical protein